MPPGATSVLRAEGKETAVWVPLSQDPPSGPFILLFTYLLIYFSSGPFKGHRGGQNWSHGHVPLQESLARGVFQLSVLLGGGRRRKESGFGHLVLAICQRQAGLAASLKMRGTCWDSCLSLWKARTFAGGAAAPGARCVSNTP